MARGEQPNALRSLRPFRAALNHPACADGRGPVSSRPSPSLCRTALTLVTQQNRVREMLDSQFTDLNPGRRFARLVVPYRPPSCRPSAPRTRISRQAASALDLPPRQFVPATRCMRSKRALQSTATRPVGCWPALNVTVAPSQVLDQSHAHLLQAWPPNCTSAQVPRHTPATWRN